MFTKDENTLTGTGSDDDFIFDTIVDGNLTYGTVIVYGLAGNDTINSLGDWYQALEVYGGEGNDLIKDNDGADFLSGDGGDDTIYSASEEYFAGGHDTVSGGDGNDTIVIVGDVVAAGDAGDDTLILGGFFGYHYKANLSGGDGTDTVVATGDVTRVTLDSIEELVVKNSVTLDSGILNSITHISVYRGKRVTLYLNDATELDATPFDANFQGTIKGSDSDDVLDFSAFGNTIDLAGGEGDDILKGNSADNKLYGDLGDDTIFGGGGNDKIEVEATDRTGLSGRGSNLVFSGSGEDEIVLGERGMSTVWGGAGDDLITGWTYGWRSLHSGELHGDGGNDLFHLMNSLASDMTIIGGRGVDVLEISGEISDGAFIDVEILRARGVTATADIFNAFQGISSLGKHIYINLSESGVFAPRSVQGAASFHGSDEDDVVDLSRTNSSQGWRGVLLGRGDDVFFGTSFDDSIRGDKGNDTFVFDDRSGSDTITDFTNDRREADVLDFSRSKIINSIADFKAHLSEDGHVSFGDTVIDLTTEAKHLENLTEANFIF
jgi:Ca2+-binding RTX toxin-like protein